MGSTTLVLHFHKSILTFFSLHVPPFYIRFYNTSHSLPSESSLRMTYHFDLFFHSNTTFSFPLSVSLFPWPSTNISSHHCCFIKFTAQSYRHPFVAQNIRHSWVQFIVHIHKSPKHSESIYRPHTLRPSFVFAFVPWIFPPAITVKIVIRIRRAFFFLLLLVSRALISGLFKPLHSLLPGAKIEHDNTDDNFSNTAWYVCVCAERDYFINIFSFLILFVQSVFFFFKCQIGRRLLKHPVLLLLSIGGNDFADVRIIRARNKYNKIGL